MPEPTFTARGRSAGYEARQHSYPPAGGKKTTARPPHGAGWAQFTRKEADIDNPIIIPFTTPPTRGSGSASIIDGGAGIVRKRVGKRVDRHVPLST